MYSAEPKNLAPPLLRHHVDDARLRVPELRAVAARLNLDFLDGVRVHVRERTPTVRAPLNERRGPNAVDVPLHFVLRAAADGIPRLASPPSADTPHDGDRVEEHAGLQEDPLLGVLHGQAGDLLGIHELRARGRILLNHRTGGSHHDFLPLDRLLFQREADPRREIGSDRNVADDNLLVPYGRSPQPVDAGRDTEDEVFAVGA